MPLELPCHMICWERQAVEASDQEGRVLGLVSPQAASEWVGFLILQL